MIGSAEVRTLSDSSSRPSEGDPFDMDLLQDSIQDWRDEIFPLLNSLPECDQLRILRDKINRFILTLFGPEKRDRDPFMAAIECIGLQTLTNQYVSMNSKKKHAGRTTRISPEEDKEALGTLKEIQPKNETDTRAMVLLRNLKLYPGQAIDTAKARTLLEGAEGKTIAKEQALRAMKLLPEIYPLIVFERIGIKTRIRFKILPNQPSQGVTVFCDGNEPSQGVTDALEDRE